MRADRFRSLAWFWFAFPGRAKTAFKYELFLNGLLQQFPLLAEEYTVRIKPTELVP